MRKNNWRMLLAALCFGTAAHAVTLETKLPDPAQEAAAEEVFRSLKCVVCEGQALADSDAMLAVQMRAHVRERIAAGNSADEVRAYFRSRYGDTILLSPPMEMRTAPLWAAPLAILAIGIIFIIRRTRREEQTP